jgi:hypothetical protein
VGVKIVVQVKLLPDAAQEATLWETLKLCNQAANRASRRAHESGVKAKTPLQRLVCDDLKAMGLSAQPAIHCARKVAGAYATLKANLKAGNHGCEGSKRRTRVENTRKDAAQPFDDRCLSWQIDARTVSIWTVHGRVTGEGHSVRVFTGPGQGAHRVRQGRIRPGQARRQLVPVRHL